jgi:hypothetical protein
MIPIAVGIGAFLALVVFVWAVAPTKLEFRKARNERRNARKLKQASRSPALPETADRVHKTTIERNEREAAVIRDAERALAQARQQGDEIIAQSEAKAAEMQTAAERRARTIVREAEEKAGELVEAAQLHVADAKVLAAREREKAEQTRRAVASLLLDLLAQAKGSPASPPTNVYTITPPEAPAKRPDEAR